jgi:hypothetical protein
MENRVHDFDSKKTRMIAKANRSPGWFQAIESAPKPYMFTSSTPNSAKPRTISTSTMREAGGIGPAVSRSPASFPASRCIDASFLIVALLGICRGIKKPRLPIRASISRKPHLPIAGAYGPVVRG